MQLLLTQQWIYYDNEHSIWQCSIPSQLQFIVSSCLLAMLHYFLSGAEVIPNRQIDVPPGETNKDTVFQFDICPSVCSVYILPYGARKIYFCFDNQRAFSSIVIAADGYISIVYTSEQSNSKLVLYCPLNTSILNLLLYNR